MNMGLRPTKGNRSTYHVIVADANPNIRSALRLLVNRQPGFEVVAESADASDLLSRVAENDATVMLLDWALPGLHDTTVLDELRARAPHVQVIVLSARPELRGEALRSGAHAFVSKVDAPEHLLASLTETIDRQLIDR